MSDPTTHGYVPAYEDRGDAPPCRTCGQTASAHRRRFDPDTCHWCGGLHRSVDCRGWDGV